MRTPAARGARRRWARSGSSPSSAARRARRSRRRQEPRRRSCGYRLRRVSAAQRLRAAGLLDGDLAGPTSTRTVRPCGPPVASATTGMPRRVERLAHAASLRVPTSSAPVPRPTRTSARRRPARPRRRTRGAPSRGQLGDQRRHGGSANLPGVPAPGRRSPGSMTCASADDAAPAVDQASPMHEPRPIETSTSPGVARTRPARPCGPWSRMASSPGRAATAARRRRPAVGMSMNDSEHSSPSTCEVASRAAARRRGPRPARAAPTRRSRRACRGAACGGVGSSSRPVISASAPM